MIGIDTNVLVRYVTQDDPEQSAAATRVVEGFDEDSPGFVSLVTVVETYWVLRRAYQVDRTVACDVISGLLDSRELVVQYSDVVRRSVRRASRGADFADAVIFESGVEAGCVCTVTFDRRAAQHAGMTAVG